jgi:hypothetical protein
MINELVNSGIYSIEDIPKLLKRIAELESENAKLEMFVDELSYSNNCEENNNLYMRNQIDIYKTMLSRCIRDFELYAELENLSVQERIKHPKYQEYRNVLRIKDSYRWRYHEQAYKLMGE